MNSEFAIVIIDDPFYDVMAHRKNMDSVMNEFKKINTLFHKAQCLERIKTLRRDSETNSETNSHVATLPSDV